MEEIFLELGWEFGKPDDTKDLKDFVLEKIDKETREKFNEAINIAANAIEDIIVNGIDHAMNTYN